MPGIITSTTAASTGTERAMLEPLGAARRQADVVPLAREQRLEDLAHDLFVVDDEHGAVSGHSQDRRSRGQTARPDRGIDTGDASGNDSVNRVPTPTALSQVIVPSCSRTMP